MQIGDILEYSQQIVAIESDNEHIIANGFFVLINETYYFVTANHAISSKSELEGETQLVLHARWEGLSTRVVTLKKWQFIDLLKIPSSNGRFAAPIKDYREDFTFCSLSKESIKESVRVLPYFLMESSPSSCHHKSFKCIKLPQQKGEPDTQERFYMAGKILEEKDGITWEYQKYYYPEMQYTGKFDNLYEFQLNEQVDLDKMKGLSGSPVFDSKCSFVGMALRYREEDGVLLVFPAEDIFWYLNNDSSSDV